MESMVVHLDKKIDLITYTVVPNNKYIFIYNVKITIFMRRFYSFLINKKIIRNVLVRKTKRKIYRNKTSYWAFLNSYFFGPLMIQNATPALFAFQLSSPSLTASHCHLLI